MNLMTYHDVPVHLLYSAHCLSINRCTVYFLLSTFSVLPSDILKKIKEHGQICQAQKEDTMYGDVRNSL